MIFFGFFTLFFTWEKSEHFGSSIRVIAGNEKCKWTIASEK